MPPTPPTPLAHTLTSARRCLAVLLLLILPAAGVGCAVTQEQELALGKENHGKFEAQSGGRYGDPAVQSYVNGIGMQMARYAGRPEMDWQFHVLNSDQINAFAVPGGYIYITQGLLFRMQNEAQLAGVLGHEAGHIAKRHSAQSMQQQQVAQVATGGLTILLDAAGYGGVGQAAGTLANMGLLKYSRDHEREADMEGLKYMSQGGYNPLAMVEVMQILKAAAGGGGGGPLGDWTSTHPDPGNRIEYLTAAIKQNYTAPAQTGKYGQPEFQQAVLARRRTALAPLPADAPVAWCGLCREQADLRRAESIVYGPDRKRFALAAGPDLIRDAR